MRRHTSRALCSLPPKGRTAVLATLRALATLCFGVSLALFLANLVDVRREERVASVPLPPGGDELDR